MAKNTTPAPEPAQRRIEYRLLDDLQANPANPKDHAVDVIDASMDRFGYIDGAVIDERTGYIVSGHGRAKTLRAKRDRGDAPPEGVRVDEQGRWLVPVQVGWASRNDAEAKAALIGLNRTTELGGWVDESLLSILDDLSQEGAGGLDGIGYTEADRATLAALLEDADELEPMSEDEFDDSVHPDNQVSTTDLVIKGLTAREVSAFRDLEGESDADRLRGLMQ